MKVSLSAAVFACFGCGIAAEYRVTRAFAVAGEPACMPALTRAPNGDFLVAFSTEWEPFPSGGVLKLTTSRDQARNWSPPRVLWKDPDPRVTIQVSNGMQTLSNGEILLPVTWCLVPKRTDAAPNEKAPHRIYDVTSPAFRREARLFRSKDNGQSWSMEDPKLGSPWWRFGRLFETADGRLIMPGEGWYVASRDFGKTWSARISLGLSFPNEVNIVPARNGAWFYVSRHDSEMGARFGPRRTFVTGFSRDQGRTWTGPEQTSVQGKMPDFLVLPSGRILFAAGAEGLTDGAQVFTTPQRNSFCTLFLSDDHGAAWKRDIAFVAESGNSPQVPADSPVMCPIDDGRILVVMQAIDRANRVEARGYNAGMSLLGNVIQPR